MNGNTAFLRLMLVIGLVLLFLAFLLRNPIFYNVFPAEFIISSGYNVLCGVIFGVGAGIMCMSSSALFTNSEDPRKMYSADKEVRKREFDLKEKKMRAKAAAGDVTSWAVLAFSYVLLMLNMPLWTVFGALIIFGLNYLMWLVYVRR